MELFVKHAQVAIVMGSKSDYEVVRPCIRILRELGIPFEVRIISAHRTPEEAHAFALLCDRSDVSVIIAVAGKAAHLGGVLAAYTVKPVIALPVQTSMMGGLDSLLSMVQMPSGIPVATVGVGGGENAGLLAAQILGTKDRTIAQKLLAHKQAMRSKIIQDDAALQQEVQESSDSN